MGRGPTNHILMILNLFQNGLLSVVLLQTKKILLVNLNNIKNKNRLTLETPLYLTEFGTLLISKPVIFIGRYNIYSPLFLSV